MIRLDRVLELFALFSDLPDDQLEKWAGLCQNASTALEGKLKAGLPPMLHMEQLCTVAAAFAYGDYLLLDQSSSMMADEMKVGDISVKNKNSSNSARSDSDSIKEYFTSQIAHLLRPDHVAFVPVGEGA